MAKVRVSFSLSLDGFGAGPDQSVQDPLGKGGMAMHEWALATRTFKRMHGGGSGGSVGVDDDFAAAGFENIGAWILGRNMFGPVRGPWPDEAGKAGGATSRHTTCRCSCSRITRVRRSR